MGETDREFAGALPALYDRYLGPFLFEPFASDLAARVAGFSGRLLEVAAGTGILTRALARVAPDATITATDLNAPMLAQAASWPGLERVSWQPADALALPFAPGAADLLTCQFGVMFFADRAAFYRSARRIVRPGGRLLLNVWDRIATNAIPSTVSAAVAACFPEDPPSFLARTPHGHHDPDVIRRELAEAGWQAITIDLVTLPGRASSAADPAIGFCQGTPLRHEIVARDPGRLEAVTAAAARAVEVNFGTGPIEGPLQALVVSAVA